MSARKPRVPDSIHDVIARALDSLAQEGAGRGDVAGLCDVPVSKVYAWGDPDDAAQRAPMSLAQARRVGREWPATAGAVLARDMAACAGGTFVPGLTIGAPCDVAAAFSALVRESAEASSAIVTGLADGAMTGAEARVARAELDQLISAAVQLRTVLDQFREG